MAVPSSPRSSWFNPPLWAAAATLGGITMMWTTYNRYVPGFLALLGLPVLVTALVLTADNALGMVLEPLVGMMSDRTRSRVGRRLPWLVVALPLAVVAFAAIPLPLERTDGAALPPFALAVAGMLVAMSLVRTPTVAIMPDLVPPSGLARASGLLQMWVGVGTLAALWTGDWLVRRFGVAAPFWVAGGATLAALAMLRWLVGRWRGMAEEAPMVGWAAPRVGRVVALLVVIAGWWFGFFFLNALLPARVPSEGTPDGATLTTGWVLVTTVLALPVGILAERWGMRVTLAGAALLVGVAALLALLPPLAPVLVLLVGLGGAGWACVLVSSLPLLLDAGGGAHPGRIVGLYYLAFAAANLAGPWLVRWLHPTGLWPTLLAWSVALGVVWGLRMRG